MEFNAFTSRLGEGQGRIAPENTVPDSGDYVFVLGDDEEDRFFNLAAGDRAEVAQDVDLTDHDLVRTNLHVRVPNSLTSGYAWEFSIIINGVKMVTVTCPPGRERTLTDVAANTSKMTSVHQVSVRFELVETMHADH
jgi:hypothetical protein